MPVVLRSHGLRVLFCSNEGSPRESVQIDVEGGGEGKFWIASEPKLAYNAKKIST